MKRGYFKNFDFKYSTLYNNFLQWEAKNYEDSTGKKKTFPKEQHSLVTGYFFRHETLLHCQTK